jgi:hypothetical protein
MERRHKSVTRNRRSGVNKDAAGKVGVGSSSELPSHRRADQRRRNHGGHARTGRVCGHSH